MHSLKLFLSAGIIAMLAITCKAPSATQSTPNKFRVLGYLPGNNNWSAAIAAIDLTAITDLNMAFINPDTNGNFVANEALKQAVAKAHSNKIRVFASIGGGNPPPYLASLLANDKRAALIASLVALAEQNNFDGIDVDIENDLINENYAPFVKELATALKQKNKLMTSALASWNASLIGDSTLQLYDFINIMSYDKTGPWTPLNPGQHSPLMMAQNDFIYFNTTRHIPAEKLLIGLPFYGYGFGNGAPESLSYTNIVATYSGSENQDSLIVQGGGIIYYNGISTIQQKVLFAINNKAAGVMIWQLLGDSKDEKSLLRVINSAIKK